MKTSPNRRNQFLTAVCGTLVLLSLSALSAQAGTIADVYFSSGPTFSGAAVVGSSGDVWNRFGTTSATNAPLFNVGGTSSGITLTYSGADGVVDDFFPNGNGFQSTSYANLMNHFLFGSGTASFTLNGLTPNTNYGLVFYSEGDSLVTGNQFQVTGLSGSNLLTNNPALSGFALGQNYLNLTGLSNGLGVLTFSVHDPLNIEFDLNGFQLSTAAAPPAATPEPSTWVMLAAGLGLFGVRSVLNGARSKCAVSVR